MSNVRWLAILALTTALASFKDVFRIGEQAELVDAQQDVLGRCRLEGGDEAAIAGHVDDRDFERGQALQGLGGNLHVAENDDLANGRDRHALDFLPVLADDQVFAALADMRAWFLEVEDGAVVALGKDAGDAGGGFLRRA